MKFCLSSRQIPTILAQADQIRVASNDYKQIYDLIEQYPEAQIILNYNAQPEKEVRDLITLAQGRLMLALFQISEIKTARDFKVPYYFAPAIQTVEQARALKNLGVSYLLLDNQAMHQLHAIKILGVPVRAIPNMSFLDGIPRENGVNGNWIRPEDIDEYSLYIDVIEFGTQPQKREETLFRIYSKDKEWPGDLNRIVQDLNYPANNGMINPEHSRRRMNCEMICATGKNCTLCYDILKISARPRFRDSHNQA